MPVSSTLGHDGTFWQPGPGTDTRTSGTWTLYWRDCNERFHRYDHVGPSAGIEELLAEIASDPTGLFCG